MKQAKMSSTSSPRRTFCFGVGNVYDTPKGRRLKFHPIPKEAGAAAICLCAGYLGLKAGTCFVRECVEQRIAKGFRKGRR